MSSSPATPIRRGPAGIHEIPVDLCLVGGCCVSACHVCALAAAAVDGSLLTVSFGSALDFTSGGSVRVAQIHCRVVHGDPDRWK